MSQAAQAKNTPEPGFGWCCRLRLAALALPVLALSACASGSSILKTAEVDPTILTGSVGGSAAPLTPEQRSDEATISNAVSSADLELAGSTPLRWANPETGARGAISELAEMTADNRKCRSFRTSRERFDGVSVYRGQVCRVAPETWRMDRFEAM